MASIFNALHIGYSGLNAAQIGINTTGHNISNAETEGYAGLGAFSLVAGLRRPASDYSIGISAHGRRQQETVGTPTNA